MPRMLDDKEYYAVLDWLIKHSDELPDIRNPEMANRVAKEAKHDWLNAPPSITTICQIRNAYNSLAETPVKKCLGSRIGDSFHKLHESIAYNYIKLKGLPTSTTNSRATKTSPSERFSLQRLEEKVDEVLLRLNELLDMWKT